MSSRCATPCLDKNSKLLKRALVPFQIIQTGNEVEVLSIIAQQAVPGCIPNGAIVFVQADLNSKHCPIPSLTSPYPALPDLCICIFVRWRYELCMQYAMEG